MPGRIVGETTDLNGRARLRPDAADPRAAHPPREGDVEHHDEPDAARARPASSTSPGSARRGCASWGRRCMSLGALREGAARAAARVPGRPTFKEFAVRVGRPARDVDRECRARARRPPRLRARARLRGHGRRAARRGHREAHARGHRPPRRGAGGGARLMKLIYEKSQPGRRASTLPRYDLPPRRAARGAPPRRAAAPAGARRARARPPLHRALDAQLRDRHRLLPARLLHDEAQPARQRARRRCCPASATSTRCRRRTGAQGALELMWRLQEILAEVAGLDAVLAPAGRRLAGRADRADADARLLRRPRRGRAARHDRHRRHRARDEPRQRDDGRLQAGEGRPPTRAATSTSTTCARR